MREYRYRFHLRLSIGGALTSLSACVGALTTLLLAGSAGAQLGTANVPLPNVMLLQDTSGSFELMIDGNTPETAGEGGTCVPGTASNPNRWGVAVQALTGNILPYYSCAAMDRTQAGFYNQYAISAGAGGIQAPYDYRYYLPFHRPISVDSSTSPGTSLNCMYTPYALPGAVAGGGVGAPTPVATGAADCSGSPCTALGFPADAIGTYAFQTTGAYGGAAPTTGQCAPAACAPAKAQTVNTAANACAFSQASNGALDGAASLMRFGLMTFDNDPADGTGVTVSATAPAPTNTTASAFSGMWSYFSGWNSLPAGTGGATGYPAGCSVAPAPFFEVGARNPAAPPWEGRLVTFPSQAADTTATIENNQLVQLAIQSMRPYGATPLAGMFADAETYLWQDPIGPGQTDNFVKGGCRAQYIIVLTDGQPNQDLGVTSGVEPGSCLGTAGSPPTAGKCPYQSAAQTAAALYAGNDPFTGLSGQSVTTFVIGFAVSQNVSSSIASCSSLAAASGFATYCPTAKPTDPQYSCCMLQQIAAAGQGGTGQAYFADTPGDLNQALGAVLGQIAKQLTSQTLPVYAPSVSYASGTGTTSTFLTSFSGATVPWTGDVQRDEIVCQGNPLAPMTQPLNPSAGDDFGLDLQSVTPNTRKFLTYQLPTPGTGASSTIRPFLTVPTTYTNDGIGAFGQAGVEVGLAPPSLTGMSNLATMLSTSNTSCENPISHAFSIPATGCAEVALQFAMAQPTVTTGDTSTPSFDAIFAGSGATAGTTRCPGAGSSCFPLGAILHSTPAFSSAPSAILRDDSYQAFATSLSASVLSPPRNPVLYVATIDGLLHAFDTTVGLGLVGGLSAGTNNELWSFIPPGVFPNLLSNYPSASNILLDGAPIVKDVVWERDYGGSTASWTSAWHTMLVAGFGAGGRGYYALDVTDPRSGPNYKAVTNYSNFPASLSGPHFQWQIASMTLPNGPPNQAELFGTVSGTPTITTVYTDPSGGSNPKELGVAILPGGRNGAPYSAVPCQRDLIANAGTYTPSSNYDDHDLNFPYRGMAGTPGVRRWAKNCTGPGSGVPGRSVTVVRIDSGEILAVFARPATSSPDVPSTLLAGKLIATPFDSPMTGTPIVYPPDVGAIAQQVFIGDADGTLWRLDLTEPNPANWRAALFFDPYNSVADTYNAADPNHLADDSESITINPITTPDRQGNLTLQFATGDQSTYTANYTIPGSPTQVNTAVNFVGSLRLTNLGTGGAALASVNWYMPLTGGERVTGPMTVFDDTFYFATFLPPNPASSALVCNAGIPKLWGLDFEIPNPTCGVGPNEGQGPTGCGGEPRDYLPNGYVANPPDANGTPTTNVVIPGVAVAVTPSCTTTSAAATDPYTGGMHTGTTGTTAGSYSLVAQIGGKNKTTNATNTLSRTLLAPNATTMVDSWATLSE